MSSKYWRLGSDIGILPARSVPVDCPELYHGECYNLSDQTAVSAAGDALRARWRRAWATSTATFAYRTRGSRQYGRRCAAASAWTPTTAWRASRRTTSWDSDGWRITS